MVFMSIITVITIITCIAVANTLQIIKRIDDIGVFRGMVYKSTIGLTITLVFMTIDGWIRFVF